MSRQEREEDAWYAGIREGKRRAYGNVAAGLAGAIGAAAIVLVIFAADARAAVKWQTSTASIFIVQKERALGCWPWHPRYLRAGVPVVAHKTLPCGTRLRICYRRCVTSVVRDRGPYIAGRDLDLDPLTQRAIGAPFGLPRVRWRTL